MNTSYLKLVENSSSDDSSDDSDLSTSEDSTLNEYCTMPKYIRENEKRQLIVQSVEIDRELYERLPYTKKFRTRGRKPKKYTVKRDEVKYFEDPQIAAARKKLKRELEKQRRKERRMRRQQKRRRDKDYEFVPKLTMVSKAHGRLLKVYRSDSSDTDDSTDSGEFVHDYPPIRGPDCPRRTGMQNRTVEFPPKRGYLPDYVNEPRRYYGQTNIFTPRRYLTSDYDIRREEKNFKYVRCFKILHTLAIAMIIMTVAMTGEMAGPTLPDLMRKNQANMEEISRTFLGRSIGIFGGNALAYYLNELYFHQMDLVICLSLMISGFASFFLAWSRHIFGTCILFSIIGFSEGVVSVTSHRILARMWSKDMKGYIHLIYFSWAVGAMLAPQLALPFLAEENLRPPLRFPNMSGNPGLLPNVERYQRSVEMPPNLPDTPLLLKQSGESLNFSLAYNQEENNETYHAMNSTQNIEFPPLLAEKQIKSSQSVKDTEDVSNRSNLSQHLQIVNINETSVDRNLTEPVILTLHMDDTIYDRNLTTSMDLDIELNSSDLTGSRLKRSAARFGIFEHPEGFEFQTFAPDTLVNETRDQIGEPHVELLYGVLGCWNMLTAGLSCCLFYNTTDGFIMRRKPQRARQIKKMFDLGIVNFITPQTVPTLLAFLFVYFAQAAGGEKAMGTFLFSYLVGEKLRVKKRIAAAMLTTFWGGYACGRLAYVFDERLGKVNIRTVVNNIMYMGFTFTFMLIKIHVNIIWIAIAFIGYFVSTQFCSGMVWVNFQLRMNVVLVFFMLGSSCFGACLFQYVTGSLMHAWGVFQLTYIVASQSAISVFCFLFMIWFAVRKHEPVFDPIPRYPDDEKAQKIPDVRLERMTMWFA